MQDFFALSGQGILLTEVAPGIDYQKDVIGLLDFPVQVSENLKEMDPRIFREEPMGISLRSKQPVH